MVVFVEGVDNKLYCRGDCIIFIEDDNMEEPDACPAT
jgi:hypothetical protein